MLDKWESKSKDDRGVVHVETIGYNQDGKVVCLFRRKVMVPKDSYLERPRRRAARPTGPAAGQELARPRGRVTERDERRTTGRALGDPPRRDRVEPRRPAHLAHRARAHPRGRGGRPAAGRAARRRRVRPRADQSAASGPVVRRSSRGSPTPSSRTTSPSGTTATTRASPPPRSARTSPAGRSGRTRAPGGETAEQVSERLDRVVAKVRAHGGRVLVFSHGHASRALAARWLDQPVRGGSAVHARHRDDLGARLRARVAGRGALELLTASSTTLVPCRSPRRVLDAPRRSPVRARPSRARCTAASNRCGGPTRPTTTPSPSWSGAATTCRPTCPGR